MKIVDDFFIGGKYEVKRQFVDRLGKIYKLGTITHLPGNCLFFGLHVIQNPAFTIEVHANQKLNGTTHVLSRARRKDTDDALNALELFHFNSINGSFCHNLESIRSF